VFCIGGIINSIAGLATFYEVKALQLHQFLLHSSNAHAAPPLYLPRVQLRGPTRKQDAEDFSS
jgi:hypothetical protein